MAKTVKYRLVPRLVYDLMRECSDDEGCSGVEHLGEFGRRDIGNLAGAALTTVETAKYDRETTVVPYQDLELQ